MKGDTSLQETSDKTRHNTRKEPTTVVTTLKYKKAKPNLYHRQMCDTMHSDKEISYLANKGQNAKRGRNDNASESAN